MSQENVDALREGYEAFSSGDIDAAFENFADDIVWRSIGELIPAGGTYNGIDEVRNKWLPEFAATFQDFNQSVDEILDCGDYVIGLGTSRATVAGQEIEDTLLPRLEVLGRQDRRGDLLRRHGARLQGAELGERPVRMPTIGIGGRAVGYDREGAGPPIVMVNGFAAARADWDPTFVAGLAEGHEVVRLDNRGVGESVSDGQPFTVDDLAGDVAEAIGALGIERPAVLGWSMGGFVAQELAATRPELVGRLILLSTRAAGDTSALSTADVKERLLDFSGTPARAGEPLDFTVFLPERARRIDEQFGDVVAEALAALPAETVDQQKEILASWGGREPQLAGIRCPALVATGAEDVVVPPANALALAAGIDGAVARALPALGPRVHGRSPRAGSPL